MSGIFRPPITDPGDCNGCGEPLNIYQDDGGNEHTWCPRCNPREVPDLSGSPDYRCHGCDEVRPDCIAHHKSYDPERVVPVCMDCHARLHANDDYLPDLTPELSRSEAESRDLVSIIGLDDSWAVEEP